MPIIFEEGLKKQISSDVLAPVYILFGDDGFLKKRYAGKLSSRVAEPDDIFNYAVFENECDLQEVYDALTQFPMMAERKCVILRDYDFEHCAKSDFDRLCELLASGCDTALLIVWFDGAAIDAKKNAKFKKLVAAAEKCGGYAVQLDHKKAPELIKILTDGAKKRGCTMDSATARYLTETAGQDLFTLQNELEKLCHYLPGGTIRKEDVDAVCIKTPEASVYQLSKDIFARNIGQALQTLDELLFLRFEPMMILYTVSSAFTDMFRLYAARQSGENLQAVAAQFGYKGREFVLERAAQNLSKYDFKRLNWSLEALVEADRQMKSFGANEQVILEQLIVRLVYILSRGERIDHA